MHAWVDWTAVGRARLKMKQKERAEVNNNNNDTGPGGTACRGPALAAVEQRAAVSHVLHVLRRPRHPGIGAVVVGAALHPDGVREIKLEVEGRAGGVVAVDVDPYSGVGVPIVPLFAAKQREPLLEHLVAVDAVDARREWNGGNVCGCVWGGSTPNVNRY